VPSFSTEDIDFSVYCSCGEGLCNQSTTSQRGNRNDLTIKPCQKCLDDAERKGYERGYEEGFAAGEESK
jgi:hypothetical protein